MSNTETEDTGPVREGRSGTWTPEDLAELVTIDEVLLDRWSNSPVNNDEAISILEVLISGGDVGSMTMGPNAESTSGHRAARDLARLIVRSLPREAMDKAVLTAIDVRPYVAALAANPEMKLRTDQKWAPDQSYPVGDGYGNWAERALGTLQENAQTTGEDYAGVLDLSTTGRDRTVADTTTYDPTKVSVSPQARTTDSMVQRQTDQQMTGQEAEVNPNVSGFTYTPLRASARVDIASLRAAVTSGDMTLADAQNQVSAANGQTGTQVLGIETGFQWDYLPNQAPRPTQLSLPDALNYIFTIPEKEVASLQRRLAEAGFFDKLGEAGMYGYIEGDPRDGVTKEAWRLAMTEAFARGTNIDQLLRDEETRYRETKQAEWEQNMPRLNKSALGVGANDIAQQLIGRNLNWQEQRDLEQFIIGLRERPVQIAGVDTFGGQNQMDSETGFSQADVAEYLDASTKKERQMGHTERLLYAAERRFG